MYFNVCKRTRHPYYSMRSFYRLWVDKSKRALFATRTFGVNLWKTGTFCHAHFLRTPLLVSGKWALFATGTFYLFKPQVTFWQLSRQLSLRVGPICKHKIGTLEGVPPQSGLAFYIVYWDRTTLSSNVRIRVFVLRARCCLVRVAA